MCFGENLTETCNMKVVIYVSQLLVLSENDELSVWRKHYTSFHPGYWVLVMTSPLDINFDVGFDLPPSPFNPIQDGGHIVPPTGFFPAVQKRFPVD